MELRDSSANPPVTQRHPARLERSRRANRNQRPTHLHPTALREAAEHPDINVLHSTNAERTGQMVAPVVQDVQVEAPFAQVRRISAL